MKNIGLSWNSGETGKERASQSRKGWKSKARGEPQKNVHSTQQAVSREFSGSRKVKG